MFSVHLRFSVHWMFSVHLLFSVHWLFSVHLRFSVHWLFSVNLLFSVYLLLTNLLGLIFEIGVPLSLPPPPKSPKYDASDGSSDLTHSLMIRSRWYFIWMFSWLISRCSISSIEICSPPLPLGVSRRNSPPSITKFFIYCPILLKFETQHLHMVIKNKNNVWKRADHPPPLWSSDMFLKFMLLLICLNIFGQILIFN